MINNLKVFNTCRRTVYLHCEEMAESQIIVNLPFPYVGFLHVQSNFSVFFCKTIPTDNTEIYLPPLGNINDFYGKVCLDNLYNYWNKTTNELIDYFWNSGFDYRPTETRAYEAFGTRTGSINSWKDLNLESILNINWTPFEDVTTLGDLRRVMYSGQDMVRL